MGAYLTLNRFVESSNQAFFSPILNKHLIAASNGNDVTLQDLPSSFSQEAMEQNRKTWGVFRESLVDTIGQRKFEWICHRYRSRLNFMRMEQSGKPLLPEHIELFSIGSNQLLSRDIKFRYPEHLRAITRAQLQERIRLVQPFPIVGRYRDPRSISGSPSSFIARFIHDKILMDKEKQLIFSDVDRQSFHAWMERFAKVAVNRELIQGQLIPAPGQDGHIDHYKVHCKIATGDGLVAYALRPATSDSTLKPLICFRPSQWAFSNEDAFETYFNDVQQNVGEIGWSAAKARFEQLMNDPSFRRNGERVSIVGYSLGGAHAQRFLEFHCENVFQAVFYSDPGIDNQTAERIRANINAMPRRSESLNIQIFRMKGDFCHYVGDKHAGWGVLHPDVNIQLMDIDHENKKIAATYLHAHRIFDNITFPYQMECVESTEELFNRLDNSKRGPDVFWYERMRRLWGGVAYVSLYSLSELIKLVSWVFGVRILRNSREPDL